MKTLLAFLFSASLAIPVPSLAVAQPSHPTVKLKIVSGVPIVDGVYCNGKGPFRFLLDTGTQSNQIEAGLARKLGVTPTFQVDLYTASGSSRVPAAKLDSLSLGSSEVRGQEFLLTSLDGVHTLSPDIRGILGQDFLSHFDYTLDFQHRELTFGDPHALGDPIPVRFSYGRMIVPSSEGELVLDSGTDTLFLFRASSRPANAVSTASSGSSVAVSLESMHELRIGKQRYHPSGAVLHPVPEAAEAGLLPASLFHSIFISNSAGYVIFDPTYQKKGSSQSLALNGGHPGIQEAR
jgi:hypothetical protein